MARLVARPDNVPRRSLWERIKHLALADVGVVLRGGVRTGSLERLEEVLLEADFGVPTTLRLVAEVERRAQLGEVRTEEEFLTALRGGIVAALRSGRSDPALVLNGARPGIVLVIGVNGAGKTTFIGKLAARLRDAGQRVLVGAGDTFRAGAVDQLREWATRGGADFVGATPGRDPAAVAVDAIEAAHARAMDVMLFDTAGRLHTSRSLMDELKKVVRVVGRRWPGAPQETLLVLDGTIGQNAVLQAKTFAEAVPITGLVVTKIDGTAKGGVAIAVHEAIDVPIKFVGVGEGVRDLVSFDAEAFAAQVLEGVAGEQR